jgi:hypothetical protein
MKTVKALQASCLALVTQDLVYNSDTADYEYGNVNPTVFIRDGVLHVSAEDGKPWADYYGEYRGGYAWINPTLEAWAKANGMYWEWQNPGCIALYPL